MPLINDIIIRVEEVNLTLLLMIQILQKHKNTQQVYYKRNINKDTIAEFLLKLSYETWESIFAENDVNEIYNSFLNIFLRHYHSCFPMTKTNKLSRYKFWITTGIRTSCKHKSELYSERRKHKNPALDKYYKDYCGILSKVIKGAKKLEYDRRILKLTNKMRTSWNLINIERGKDMNNQIIQSIDIDDKTTADHQTIANTINKHFIMVPEIINNNNVDNYNPTMHNRYNQNVHHLFMANASQTSFPSMKFTCTTEKEIDSIIKFLKPSNSSGYDEITTKYHRSSPPTLPLH
jgi:hypothetical protein